MRRLLIGVVVCFPGWAAACGGFFCDRSQPRPPVQASERVIFVQEADQMTALVQIEYQGAADDFAWVVPVPSVPQLDVADPALFDDLDRATTPRFTFKFAQRTQTVSDSGAGMGCSDSGGDVAMASSDGVAEETDSDVRVIGREAVGPFDTVVIDSDNASAMVSWLQANGYALADRAADVLRDYVAKDHYFVALKLRSEVGVGALQPLALRYTGDEPCIPLRITAFASTPELAVTAFILSDRRTAPSNFAHVRPDYQAVRPGGWTGTTYSTEVRRAIDGHPRAFITELAGPTSGVVATNGATRELLRRAPYITRLYGLIRPADMTIDPMFEPATDGRDVSNRHFIDLRDDPAFARVVTRRVETSVAGVLALPMLALLFILGLRRRR